MIEVISKKIGLLDLHFRSTNTDFSERERLYSRAIKLNEEVGELMEAILHESDKNQRIKEKDIDLDSELADVAICLLLLSNSREKDIWQEIDSKLTKQMERFNISE